MRTWNRLLAAGGVAGPATFVTAWAALGRRSEQYSPISDAISQLAHREAPTRVAMTTALVVDGIGITAYGSAVAASESPLSGACAVMAGLATVAVAAFPLGEERADRLHVISALVGYAGVAATPVAAAPQLWRNGKRMLAGASVATGLISGALLAVSLRGGPRRGLLQRAGLTLGDTWIAMHALARASERDDSSQFAQLRLKLRFHTAVG